MIRGKQSRYNTASIKWVLRKGLSDKMTAMLMFIDKESSYKDWKKSFPGRWNSMCKGWKTETNVASVRRERKKGSSSAYCE